METCFFFRSGNELRKKTASTRRGTPWSDMMTPKPPATNFFPLSPQEPPSRVHWRNDAWESTTRVMEHTAQRTLESFHQEAFARVENFVRNPKPGAEIPTVLVYAGASICCCARLVPDWLSHETQSMGLLGFTQGSTFRTTPSPSSTWQSASRGTCASPHGGHSAQQQQPHHIVIL